MPSRTAWRFPARPGPDQSELHEEAVDQREARVKQNSDKTGRFVVELTKKAKASEKEVIKIEMVPVFALFAEGPETLVDALARILNFRLTRGELLEGKLPILGVLRGFLR